MSRWALTLGERARMVRVFRAFDRVADASVGNGRCIYPYTSATAHPMSDGTPMEEQDTANKYLVARLSQALATDERTNALDVQILLSGGRVFIMGQVACAERRRAAELVARELLPPNMGLVNELWVQTFDEPTGTEKIG